MDRSILSRAEGDDVAGLYEQVKEYLKPLNLIVGIFSAENKENMPKKSVSQIHPLAKKFVPFLAPLLKACCNNLTRGYDCPDEASQLRATELFAVLKFALGCFDALRPCLVGSPYEIELQRYWMVRRLMAWKRFVEARLECWKTLDSLRQNVFASNSDMRDSSLSSSCRKKDAIISSMKKVRAKDTSSCSDVNLFGERAREADSSLVALMVGLVTDLIICTGESRRKDFSIFEKIPLLVEQLRPWLKTIDKCTAEKQNSLLFKGLHKCTVFMIMEYQTFKDQLIREMSVLAIEFCANASIKDQLIKVTHGICSQLVSIGTCTSSMVEELYNSTVSKLFKAEQMWKIYSEHEINDILECYCEHVEDNPTLRRDTKNFLHEIAYKLEQVAAFPLAVVVHLYAIGLGFKDIKASELFSDTPVGYGTAECAKKEERKTASIKFCQQSDDPKLLYHIIKLVEYGFHNFHEDNERYSHGNEDVVILSNCKPADSSGLNSIKFTTRSVVSVFMALAFLLRASQCHVQEGWELFISNQAAVEVHWNSDFEHSFYLLCQVFIACFSCNSLSVEDKKALKKSDQVVFLAVTSVLRFRLMRFEAVEDCYALISTIVSADWIDMQGLKRITSSTYNIGVQMFNLKKFHWAHIPLKLACNAAWLRVSLLLNDSTQTGKSESDCNKNCSVSDATSDAIGKSLVLIDSLRRCEDKTTRETLIDCFRRWSKADPQLTDSTSLRSFVKYWVKIICSDCKDHPLDDATAEEMTLVKALCKAGCSLSLHAQGKMLEEELLAYYKVEGTFPKSMQTRILGLLLEDVYVTKDFLLERSRILLEKCKGERSASPANLDSCMDCLTDAFSCLRSLLEDSSYHKGNGTSIDSAHHQLACTYCVHAFFTQEFNTNSEVICSDITLALENWDKVVSVGQTECLINIAIPMLLSMSELLALKGFIYLQSQVQRMIVKICSSLKKMTPMECCSFLWRENRLSHVFCCLPFSGACLHMLMEMFGSTVNSIEFWEKSTKYRCGTILDFQSIFFAYNDKPDILSDTGLAKCLNGTISITESLEERASTLLSNGLKSSQSALLASNLLYILSKRYQQEGKLALALKHSRESLSIRKRICQRKFKLLDKKVPSYGDNNSKCEYRSGENEILYMETLAQVATNSWPSISDSDQSGENGLSQWVVLGLYLESLMQAGVLFEMTGASDDAERIFLEGLKISNAQDILVGRISFGSCLGEIYRKRHLWEAAETAMKDALEILRKQITSQQICNVCHVTMEAVLLMRIGDYIRRCPKDKKCTLISASSMTSLEAYILARQKLDSMRLPRDDSLCSTTKVGDGSCISCTSFNQDITKKNSSGVPGNVLLSQDIIDLCHEMSQTNLQESTSVNKLPATVMKKATHRKAGTKNLSVDTCRNTRLRTRSRNENALTVSKTLGNPDRCIVASHKTLEKLQINPDAKHVDICKTSNGITTHNKISTMQELFSFHWDIYRRSLLSRVLLQIGKFYEASKQFDRVYETGMENICVLSFDSCRNGCLCSFGTGSLCDCQCSSKKSNAKMFVFEWAVLLYHISWISLNKDSPLFTWTKCCSFAENKFTFVLKWLHHSFFICSEMPVLLRKVSTLLALIYLPAKGGGPFETSKKHFDGLSANQCAVYFHQASIGATFRQDHLAVLEKNLESALSEHEGYCADFDKARQTQNDLRIVPESMEDFETFIRDFFKNAPQLTIVCISLLDSKYACILEDFAADKPPSWILLSRFSSEGHPVALCLPITSILKGTPNGGLFHMDGIPLFSLDDDDSEEDDLGNGLEFNCHSRTVIDVVAEEFTFVLKESEQSTSSASSVSSYEDRSKWWQWRSQLDQRLANLLKGMEEDWLGPWKCFLLGEPLQNDVMNKLDEHTSKIMEIVESVADANVRKNAPVDKDILKILLGSITSLTFGEIGKGVSFLLNCRSSECCQSSKEFLNLFCDRFPKDGQLPLVKLLSSQSTFCEYCQQVIEHVFNILHIFLEDLEYHYGCNKHENLNLSKKSPEENKHAQSYEIKRQPVVLVLDSNSQALPWESLPILRNHELYRMPCVGSILALMISQCRQSADLGRAAVNTVKPSINKPESSKKKNATPFKSDQYSILPVVDPYDTFYLLNPSGDLLRTQTTFGEWFKNQKGWQGKTGLVPTQEEYILALQEKDLFIYFGHGTGEQYLPRSMMRKLNRCAAALLMGCSSGRLSYRGDYEPVGVPLSYLMAGCPSIIANLWDVTDGDIDRFSKVLLDNWLASVSNDGRELHILEGIKTLRIREKKTSRRGSRNNKDDKKDSCFFTEVHMGSSIAAGRNKCKLPYLIGAAPVCYGVPTVIRSKRTEG